MFNNTIPELHEHANHVTYKFPVYLQYVGELYPDIHISEYWDQYHAFIYSDGNIALTIYEYRYYMWFLESGNPSDKKSAFQKDWKLSNESCIQIKKYVKEMLYEELKNGSEKRSLG